MKAFGLSITPMEKTKQVRFRMELTPTKKCNRTCIDLHLSKGEAQETIEILEEIVKTL